MLSVQIKKISPHAVIPKRMTEHAAGYDIYSSNIEPIHIPPKSIEMISTGFSLGLPTGFEAQIRPRSGLAWKHQIGVLNSPGTIDADYRGEVKILLYNFGTSDFIVTPSMRIAQMVIAKYEVIQFQEVIDLSKTNRSDGGFGHTKLHD